MGSITVCPVQIFPPPTELLVCYQPHRQEVMPGQKSIYETFLVHPCSPHSWDRAENPLLFKCTFFPSRPAVRETENRGQVLRACLAHSASVWSIDEGGEEDCLCVSVDAAVHSVVSIPRCDSVCLDRLKHGRRN
jgi:hypothetical protein